MTLSAQRAEYATAMKRQLDDLNAQIDALETQAHEAKKAARQQYKMELGKLRRQSSEAVSQLESLKLAGEAQWDKLVGEMDKVRDAFVHAFGDFKSRV